VPGNYSKMVDQIYFGLEYLGRCRLNFNFPDRQVRRGSKLGYENHGFDIRVGSSCWRPMASPMIQLSCRFRTRPAGGEHWRYRSEP
jgi:hypothetical protein